MGESLQLTVINLFHAVDEGGDAGSLEEFCRTHEVRGWVEHFFVDGGNPRLAMVLEYEELVEARASGRPLRGERDFRWELPAAATHWQRGAPDGWLKHAQARV